MILEFMTAHNHGYSSANKGERATHCCGCWHVKINEQDPLKPYIVCNECGEVREFQQPVGLNG